MLITPIIIFFVAIFGGALFLTVVIWFFKRRRARAIQQFYGHEHSPNSLHFSDDNDDSAIFDEDVAETSDVNFNQFSADENN